MRAQSLLPRGASARPFTNFFSRAITSFQSSGAPFQVIATLPPASSFNAASDDEPPLPAPLPPRVRPQTLVVLDSSFNPPTRAHLRMATSAIDDEVGRAKSTPNGLRLLLLLAINNADKAPKPASFEQRLAMMWAFASDIRQIYSIRRRAKHAAEQGGEALQDGFAIDMALSTKPYFHEKSASIDSASFYKSEEGRNMEQVILAGYDTLIRIFNPRYYGPPADPGELGAEETPMQRALSPFFARARLRVMMRADDEWGSSAEQTAYLDDLLHGDGLSRVGGSKEWGSKVELVAGRSEGEYIVSSTYARVAAKSRAWEKLDKMVTLNVRNWIEQENLYAE